MSLMAVLNGTPPGKGPFSVLMRHAERFEFIDYGDEPVLTQKGHQDAYKLGWEVAPHARFRVFHSPIERCLQTARGICDGVNGRKGHCEVAGDIELLGPSLFIVDREGIIRSLEGNDRRFVRLWFDGKISEDVIVPMEKAAQQTFSLMTGQLKGDPVFTINVSHDWNIMVLLERYFPFRHEEMEYPGFLSSVVAWRETDTIVLQYGEQICRIDPSGGQQ